MPTLTAMIHLLCLVGAGAGKRLCASAPSPFAVVAFKVPFRGSTINGLAGIVAA